MEFFRRAAPPPLRLGVFPGTFNPVTVAHLAVAEAALTFVDEVVFVLPRRFPHKDYSGASFEDRLNLLSDAVDSRPQLSIATSKGGLFLDIAADCRAAYGEEVRLTFLCGRDAAERIATWDYGRPGAIAEMLTRFDLLVAARSGDYCPPKDLDNHCAPLPLNGPFDHVSASEVRKRVAAGEAWEHLVPASIRLRVREIYTPR